MLQGNRLWGAFLALVASVSWGAMFPVASHSFQYIDTFYFTIFRYIPVALILAVILYKKEGKAAFKTEGRGGAVLFYGVMAFTVYNLFIFWGQDLLGDTGTLLASIMEALCPMISVLLVWGLTRKRPNIFTLGFIGLAFIGVLLVVTKGDLNFMSSIHTQMIPLVILFFGVFGWVVYSMGGDRFPEWSTLRFSTLTLIYGIGTTTVIVLLTSLAGWTEVPTLEGIYAIRYDLLFMIVFPGVIALVGWNEAVRILKPINSLLFITFVPVTTLIIGSIQGYELLMIDYVGTFFIIAALLLNNLHQRYLLRREALRSKQVYSCYERPEKHESLGAIPAINIKRG